MERRPPSPSSSSSSTTTTLESAVDLPLTSCLSPPSFQQKQAWPPCNERDRARPLIQGRPQRDLVVSLIAEHTQHTQAQCFAGSPPRQRHLLPLSLSLSLFAFAFGLHSDGRSVYKESLLLLLISRRRHRRRRRRRRFPSPSPPTKSSLAPHTHTHTHCTKEEACGTAAEDEKGRRKKSQ